MAVPVTKGEELELHVDSLAYGGNGVARLDGFVVFVRRGLPGDTVRARVTKVKRSHAEAIALDVICSPAPTGWRRRASTSARAAGAASRISPTRPRSPAKELQVRDALERLGGLSASSSSRSSRPRRRIHYRNKLEYSFTETPGRACARLPPGGALGRGARRRALLADDRPRQRPSRTPCATGRGQRV